MIWLLAYYLTGLVLNGGCVVYHALRSAEEDDELLRNILALMEFLARVFIWPVIWIQAITEIISEERRR